MLGQDAIGSARDCLAVFGRESPGRARGIAARARLRDRENGSALDPKTCDRARIARATRASTARSTRREDDADLLSAHVSGQAREVEERPCSSPPRPRPSAPGSAVLAVPAGDGARNTRVARGGGDGVTRAPADRAGIPRRRGEGRGPGGRARDDGAAPAPVVPAPRGASPSAVATTRRVQRAKALVDDTAMSMATIAFAAGSPASDASTRVSRGLSPVADGRSPRAPEALTRRRCRGASPVAIFRREEPTMAKGTLIAAMSIGQAAEDEFQDCTTPSTCRSVSASPASSRATAGSRRRSQDLGRDLRLDNVKVLASPAYLAIGARTCRRGPSGHGKVERVMRFEGIRSSRGTASPGRRRRSACQCHEHRARARGRVQRVVRQRAHPGTRRRPRVLCARRFRGTATASTSRSTTSRRPRCKSRRVEAGAQSDWTSRLQPHFRDHLRLVLRRYVRGA